MKLSLSKAIALLEKAEGRLAEDLAGIYMESVRASGPGSRAAVVWDGLKSAKSALGMSGGIARCGGSPSHCFLSGSDFGIRNGCEASAVCNLSYVPMVG